MRSFKIILISFPLLTTAYNPFKTSKRTEIRDNYDSLPSLSKFDPIGLLDSTSRKPEIYTKALLELKRLEEEPLCHRIAAQMLMSNCQGLETSSEDDYQYNSAQLQRHHVESFAASLAICDLERGRFKIPNACSLFTSSVLLSASQTGTNALDVSPEHVGQCLEALGQHHSHWNTWLSYRDKSLLFCRAARIDIDKDQSIMLHMQLIKVMADLANGMERDIQILKDSMADHTRAADSYFESMIVRAELLKSKILETFHSFSGDIGDLTSSIKSATRGSKDVERVIKNVLNMVIANTAELAFAHEKSLEQQSQVTKARTDELETLASTIESSVGRAGITAEAILALLVATYERQQAMYQDVEFMLTRSKNVTDFLVKHRDDVEMISLVASGIHENLEKSALSLKFQDEQMGLRPSISGLAVLVFSSLVTLMAGNYGLPPSLPRNAGLLITGLAIGECINLYLDWASRANATTFTASTHKGRIHTLPITSVNPEPTLDSATQVNTA